MQKSIIDHCKNLIPNIDFKSSHKFYWSPNKLCVYYDENLIDTDAGKWALLHETAHAYLSHSKYTNDLSLLLMEIEAWKQANIIALDIGIKINNDHIQDCLDSYREWLHARSTCPKCSLNTLQIDNSTYECINCRSKWTVSKSRFCRPYRTNENQFATI